MTSPIITINIPGHVVPKARPRVTKKGTYMPAKYQQTIEKIRLMATACLGQVSNRCDYPIADKVRLEVLFIRKGGGDIDNLCGSAMDGIQGIILKNDSQVKEIEAQIIPVTEGYKEQTEIKVYRKE